MTTVRVPGEFRIAQFTKDPNLLTHVFEIFGGSFKGITIDELSDLPGLLMSFPSEIIVLDWRGKQLGEVERAMSAINKLSGYSKTIIIADHVSEVQALSLTELGVFDHLNADSFERLPASIMRAIDTLESQKTWFRSKEAFETAYLQSKDGIITGSPNGIFFNCNDAAVRLFGYGDQTEFLKLTPEDLCCPKQPDGNDAVEVIGFAIETAIRDGNVVVEAMFRRKDGTSFLGTAHIDSCQANGQTFFQVTIRDITHERSMERELASTTQRLNRALQSTVWGISKAIESRDLFTAGHQKRVGALAYSIGEQMGLAQDRLIGIYFGGLVHDIGKIQVPAEILNKPAKLTRVEYLIIQTHPEVGYEILKDIEFPWPLADIAHQHHERLDGTGYPQGLQGQQICLEARVVAVADVIEAMMAHRPYRPGLSLETALEEIQQHCGTRYDEEAVNACLAILKTTSDLERLTARRVVLDLKTL